MRKESIFTILFKSQTPTTLKFFRGQSFAPLYGGYISSNHKGSKNRQNRIALYFFGPTPKILHFLKVA